MTEEYWTEEKAAAFAAAGHTAAAMIAAAVYGDEDRAKALVDEALAEDTAAAVEWLCALAATSVLSLAEAQGSSIGRVLDAMAAGVAGFRFEQVGEVG